MLNLVAAGAAAPLVYFVGSHSLMRVDIAHDMVRQIHLGLSGLAEMALVAAMFPAILFFLHGLP